MPVEFAAERFVVPHFRDSGWTYHLLSPEADATVTVTVGGVSDTFTLTAGVAEAYAVGAGNPVPGVIEADRPILVTHVAEGGLDVYPVAPPATELWGVRRATLVAALEDGTTVTATASDGSQWTYVLQAGEQRRVNVGVDGNQGIGDALYLAADRPIAAVSAADGDGGDQVALWPEAVLATRFTLPVDAQYLAVACPALTTLTVRYPDGTTESQACSGDGSVPGKGYFGAETNGAHLAAGTALMADRPVYVIYDSVQSNDERQLLGAE